MSYRRVRKESGELSCTVLVARYGPQSVASASDLFFNRGKYTDVKFFSRENGLFAKQNYKHQSDSCCSLRSVTMHLRRYFPFPSGIMPTSSREKESGELSCTVLVARYGPQSVASASGQVSREGGRRRTEISANHSWLVSPVSIGSFHPEHSISRWNAKSREEETTFGSHRIARKKLTASASF